MYVIEQYIGCSYALKTAFKALFFAGLPLLYAKLYGSGTIRESLGIDHIKFNQLKTGFILGGIVFCIIISAYFLLGSLVDFDGIKNELQTKLMISASTFIFVGLYITFINSLMEEFFFRGFIFLEIYKSGNRKTAYFISSVLFGLYHMAMFKTWFPPSISVLAVASLILSGLVFNRLNIKSRHFLNSWIVHIFADCAIIMIGIKMFYF